MANDLVVKDKEVLSFFQQSKDLDMGDASDSDKAPTLKLTHKQSENELLDGSLARAGWFYHTSLKQQFSELDAHFLYIKKTELPSFSDKSVMQLTYIIGGVLKEQKVPFILYVKGMSLGQLFEYMKDITEYAGNPEMPLPMYALTTKLSVIDRDSTKYGKVKAMNFSIEKDKDNRVVIESNIDTLRSLSSMIDPMRLAIERLIANLKGETEQVYEENVPQERVAEDQMGEVEDISDDIPF